jgi:hypothetical protein
MRGTRTPTVTLSTIGYRLSPIGDHKPPGIQGEARLRSATIPLLRVQPPAHTVPVPQECDRGPLLA